MVESICTVYIKFMIEMQDWDRIGESSYRVDSKANSEHFPKLKLSEISIQ
jgi:hypothetical protein